jgi:hypothetical protein
MSSSKMRRIHARVAQLERYAIRPAPTSVVYEWTDLSTKDIIFSIQVAGGQLRKA